MKSLNSDKARHVLVRAVVRSPAVTVALVVSIALALTPFGATQVMALVASTTLTTPGPTATATPSPTTSDPSPTAIPKPTTDAAPLPTPIPTPSGSPEATVVVPNETLAPTGRTGPSYPLTTSNTLVAGTTSLTAVVVEPNLHGPFTTTSTQCGICHRTHAAQGPNLLTKSSPQSTLCFTCHDGTGANTNVRATYTDPAVPQNVVSDRKIFRHDTLAATNHTSASLNEFGSVSNRHSECSDCHNSHQARGTDSVSTTTGFTNSGRLSGVSGVSVSNGAAGTAPVYSLLDAKTDTTAITREYQLCFKCHSGFTTLDSNNGFTPSRYRLDKGIEFNPANPSYHPVEAAGKNPSPKMAASLAGPSPYKQWNFTTSSVISCANCHSNYQRFNLVTKPAANASSPLHASNTAGILRQPYRNRLLKPAGEAYKDSDFALCLMCHSNTPFSTDGGGSDRTNFFLHGYHTAALAGQGNPLNLIDQPDAGGGNAICAECHFRQHSTTFKDTTVPQTINGTRLVSFSPNVKASSTGERKWTSTGIGQGSCTLTCHGHDHTGTTESYP